MNKIQTKMSGRGLKIGIVAGRFNDFITKQLVSGAEETFINYEVNEDDIDLVHVPGAFEIPLAAKTMAEAGKYDVIIALGCVIRGSTSHYDYVCNQAAKGILEAGLSTSVPVIFGIVTTENIEQAVERAGTKMGNKGIDASISGIEMANLIKVLKS